MLPITALFCLVREKKSPLKGVDMPLSSIEDAEREAADERQRLEHARKAWLLLVQSKGPVPMGIGRELLALVGHSDIDVQQALWQLEARGELEIDDSYTVRQGRPSVTLVD